MKFTWQPDDISSGRIVCRPEHQFSDRKNIIERGFKPDGWTAKWTYKIGWLAGGNLTRPYLYTEPENRADFCLICMTDGMILEPMTTKEMASWLNKNKMMPMPHEWFVATVEFLKTINERGNG